MPPTIVVIDDDAGNNQLIQTLLSGYRVITSDMAEEGLEIIYQLRPNLILIDLGVATLGFELMQPDQAQVLRAEHQDAMNHSVFDVPGVYESVENHPNPH